MAWTEERVKKLTLLWKTGNSASKIGIELDKRHTKAKLIAALKKAKKKLKV